MKQLLTILPVTLALAATTASFSCKSKESSTGGGSGSGGGSAEQDEPAGSYVLVSKDYAPKPGTVMELRTDHDMTGGSFSMAAEGQKLEGALDITETEEVRVEVLAADKVKVLIGKHEEKQVMKMNGQEMPQPAEPKPLVGVPVLVTKSGGTWTAAREDGKEATAEEKKELDDIVESLLGDDDRAVYGTEARKPGDTWTVKGTQLPFLKDFENAEGEMTVTFDKVAAHEGSQCAFLSGTLKVTGSPAEMEEGTEGTITMEGTYKVIRSLEHREDVSAVIDAKMDAEMKLPVGTMTMKGPAKMEIKATVK
jgi:hypothetical protein